MSLIVYERHKYVSTYRTNLNYLLNMTSLQMNPLEEMEWIEDSKYIRTGLWLVPWITFSKSDATKYFIDNLNDEIMVL